MNEHGLERTGRVAISLELGDIFRFIAIIIVSFLSTALISILIKGLMRNNITLLIILSMAVFVSVFLAMRLGKAYMKSYAERYGWLVIPSALAALFLLSSVKAVVFVGLFVAHALACFFLRTLKNTARIGIELIMVITVLGSFVYGPKTGALLGATAMLMDYALSARFSYFFPVTTTAYALIGLIAGSFSSLGIAAVGIAATVIYNLATSFIIVAFMGGDLGKCVRFGLSNLALNFVLFTAVAPKLLSILS